MRSVFSFFLAFLLTLTAASAQTDKAETTALKQANDLLAQRKYSSAFALLQKFDRQNTRPAVVMRKQEIALSYYITTRDYESFSLKDLTLLESLEQMRAQRSYDSAYRFPIETALLNLKRRNPTNYKLDKALGDYYYSAQQCDCAEKAKGEDRLFALMVRHYEVAHLRGYGDYLSYYALGYAHERLGNFAQAVGPFKRSIQLKKDFPDAHYHLAYSLLELKQLENARDEVRLALNLYQDEQFKSDAAYMLADIEEQIKRAPKSALKPAAAKKPTDRKAATRPEPKAAAPTEISTAEPAPVADLATTRLKLLAALKGRNQPEVVRLTNQFFQLAPKEESTYGELLDLYLKNDQATTLTTFFTEQAATPTQEPLVQGYLRLYLGHLYLEQKNAPQAHNQFVLARGFMVQALPANNRVFAVIDQLLQSTPQE
ncbi:TPR repeat-containing protein [Hymenobacter roseosalivarius DSM 11622]|uniref:TPR repeat-containing protein n=1 Tax=Hymenobacter roseosalivarius DSM 11622 TaxID=645990 RepID=A0A1W1UQV0_9BACT|nr:tetratricopeptide repeat protein [Hymenobacter roseosalivarius]SMB83074.1 TPR repeat-containing protein [Hymenobacter roseosalivarius DSM 11622]